MAIGQRLEIRQGQALVMTPQLQQAIKLLQLSTSSFSPMSRTNWSAIRCWSARPRPEGAHERDAAPVAAESQVERLDQALEHGVAAETALDNGFENVYAGRSRADAAERGDPDLPAAGRSIGRAPGRAAASTARPPIWKLC